MFLIIFQKNKMPDKILIIHTQKTSFVNEDIEIISQIGNTEEYLFNLEKNPLRLFGEILKQLLFLIKNNHRNLSPFPVSTDRRIQNLFIKLASGG